MRTQRRSASVSLFVLLALLTSFAFAQPRFDFATAPGNLSKDVVPNHYRLSFDLDPGKDTFSGTATIAIRIARATTSFAIHAHELTAGSAVLTSANGQSRPLRVEPGQLLQSWQLTAADGSPFEAGKYVLRIEYTDKVQATGSGLFRVPYRARGKPAAMLATQLEAYSRAGFSRASTSLRFARYLKFRSRRPPGTRRTPTCRAWHSIRRAAGPSIALDLRHRCRLTSSPSPLAGSPR